MQIKVTAICILGLMAICLHGQASLSETPNELMADLKVAAAVQDATLRLGAFDAFAAKYLTNDSASSSQMDGKWISTIVIDPLYDSKKIVLSLRAVSGRGTIDEPILLVITFAANKVSVYIDWNTPIFANEILVTTRIGKAMPVAQKWTNHDSFGTLYKGDVKKFIQSIEETDSLVAQITTSNENRKVAAVFDVGGLKDMISKHVGEIQP